MVNRVDRITYRFNELLGSVDRMVCGPDRALSWGVNLSINAPSDALAHCGLV
jgi:hypothetical protein